MLEKLGPLGAAAALAMVINVGAATPSSASFLGLGHSRAPAAAVTDAQIAQIQRAHGQAPGRTRSTASPPPHS